MKVKSIVRNVRTAGADLASQLLRPAPLVAALSCIALPLTAAHAAYDSSNVAIGDLSIYKPGQDGGANVMMMLDVSGSMGMIELDIYDIYGSDFNGVSVDSIFDDYNYSCVSNGETRRVRWDTGEYEDLKVWENNHGLGLFNESVTIKDEETGKETTLTYTLQGCTNGEFVEEPDRKECTTEEVDERVDGTGYRGVQDKEKWFTRFAPSDSSKVDFVQDNNGEYFYWGYKLGTDDNWYHAFLTVADYPDHTRNQRWYRYRLAGKIKETTCTPIPGGTKWTLTNPDGWTLSPAGESTPDSRWQGKPGVSLGGERLDRLSRLKRALIQSLGTYTAAEIAKLPAGNSAGYGIALDGRQVTAGDYKIASNSLVGIGQFSADETASYRDGKTGQILVAAQELTAEHRIKLIKTISEFFAAGGTPAANAYAEAGAYMLGTSTKGYGSISGFSNPVSSYETKGNVKTDASYNEAGTEDDYKCYGKGIYFLTDGAPNTATYYPYSYYNTWSMMHNSLINKTSYSDDNALSESNVEYVDSGWAYIGNYAKALRNHADRYEDIRTATVGFGGSFVDLKKNKTFITNRAGATEEIIDCDADTSISQDARNLCKWGSQENYTEQNGIYSVLATDKKWGGGGFTAAETPDEIAESLIAFMRKPIPFSDPTPGGTITVPKDPYRGGSITPYAYLPMLKPNIDSGMSTWQGNVKKYETKNGTLYGRNNERLYSPLTLTDRGGELQKDAADLWSQTTTGDNRAITSGGFYARLKAPNSTSVANTRKVFVESYGTGAANGVTNIAVADDGTPTGFAALTDAVYGGDGNDDADKAKRVRSARTLLNFLGYNVDPTPVLGETIASVEQLDMSKYMPLKEVRNVGGVIHSNPALVSFSAEVDDLGQVTTDETKRDEYLLFGSMDGALHLVDATTGEEKWALVLQEMFRKQSEALVHNNKGLLRFGVDAPWLVSAKYNYQAANDGKSAKVTLFNDSAFADADASDDANAAAAAAVQNTSNFLPLAAYGGFRLGGDGLYAIVPDKSNPKILFSITPDTDNTSPVLHNSAGEKVIMSGTKNYDNVGQIWSRVTMARLFNTSTATKPLDVIVFGGGYDERYESPDFVPNATRATDTTKGSSIYIADAETGNQLWRWDNPHNHSIVGGVTPLDRDADGYFDYLYFADLGGNVFRAAFVNGKGKTFNEVSVTRVFAASAELPADKKSLAYRFYNRPVVSFYNDEFSGELFAVINVASGNRSSPLAKQRNTSTYANKVYGIIDREITTGSLLANTTTQTYNSSSSGISQSSMLELGASKVTGADESTNTARIAKLCSPESDGSYKSLCKKKVTLVSDIIDNKTGSSKVIGWFSPLTSFDGYAGVKNVKAFGDYRVVNGVLYVSAYESDLSYDEVDSCDSDIKGVTENKLYCLPYGVCMDDSSKNGSGGYIPVSKGMQELTFGALDADNTNISTLIGTSTIKEKKDVLIGYNADDNKGNIATNCQGSDGCSAESQYSNWIGVTQEGGDGLGAVIINTSRFVLVPQRWYELTEKVD